MYKKLLVAALVAASFCAQAQTIKIYNSCREKSRIVNFTRFDRNDKVLERYTLGSACPTAQIPVNQLIEGNYSFEDLPIHENEEWLMLVERDGETIKREALTQKGFWTALAPSDKLTIIIAPKLACNCTK